MGTTKNDLAYQRDVVAEPEEPGVVIANRKIDVDPGKELCDGTVR